MRVTCATVCGSDLHLYQGEVCRTCLRVCRVLTPQAFELKDGDILGHESAGVVEKIGKGMSLRPPEVPYERRTESL